jgi:hypothetical protein
MNWLAWRQRRPQAAAGLGALAVICAFLAVTGTQVLDAYRASGLSRCLGVGDSDCRDLTSAFTHRYTSLQFFLLFVLMIPVLVGMFWGAPLVARELEAGTHRLVWTQGVTRLRWIATKLAIVGASALVFSAVLAVGITWWSDPFLKTGWGRFEPGLFDLQGFVPVAYTMFAFALGVAIGIVTRRTLPAVFTTLAVYTAVRLTILLFLRRHYLAAKHVVYGFSDVGPVHHQGDWILREATIDRAGAVVSSFGGIDVRMMAEHCPGLPKTGEVAKEAVFACMQRLGLRSTELYHPAERFWTFQAIEAGIFLALTALLVVFIVRRVKRVS